MLTTYVSHSVHLIADGILHHKGHLCYCHNEWTTAQWNFAETLFIWVKMLCAIKREKQCKVVAVYCVGVKKIMVQNYLMN